MSLVAAATLTAGAIAAGATIYGANAQAEAAKKASQTQSDAAQRGIDEQRRQFDVTQQNYAPYLAAGKQGLSGQLDLAGVNGPEAQMRAIDMIQNGPQFSSLLKQGENALLQNASATGGVRGGNTQGALMNYRPMLLNQLLSEQYNRLGGLTSLGQASAAGQASIGQANANSIADLLAQQGRAQAGGDLAEGQKAAGYANAFTSGVGTILPVFTGGFGKNLLPSNSGGK